MLIIISEEPTCLNDATPTFRGGLGTQTRMNCMDWMMSDKKSWWRIFGFMCTMLMDDIESYSLLEEDCMPWKYSNVLVSVTQKASVEQPRRILQAVQRHYTSLALGPKAATQEASQLAATFASPCEQGQDGPGWHPPHLLLPPNPLPHVAASNASRTNPPASAERMYESRGRYSCPKIGGAPAACCTIGSRSTANSTCRQPRGVANAASSFWDHALPTPTCWLHPQGQRQPAWLGFRNTSSAVTFKKYEPLILELLGF